MIQIKILKHNFCRITRRWKISSECKNTSLKITKIGKVTRRGVNYEINKKTTLNSKKKSGKITSRRMIQIDFPLILERIFNNFK
jgi:hypothetical protein